MPRLLCSALSGTASHSVRTGVILFSEFLPGKYYIFVYRILSMDTASSFSQQLFEQLFRQYKRKYLLIANSYVRDSKTAEDIVHDSFMAVWEHRDNINGANIEAYLYKVIRNNCLMYRRNQQIGQAVYEQIKLKEWITIPELSRVATRTSCSGTKFSKYAGPNSNKCRN